MTAPGEKRNVVTSLHRMVAAGIGRDLERARNHADGLLIVLDSHTRWERAEGDFCDYDGAEWPCATMTALGFLYDVREGEVASRKRMPVLDEKAAKGSRKAGNGGG